MQRPTTYYQVEFREFTIGLRLSSREEFASDRAALFQVLFAGEYDVLLEAIQPGDVVVDCGANIGCFTILAAIRAGPRGVVLAVEPDPENAKVLRHNVAANSIQNVIVEESALAGVAGQVVRFSSGGVTAKIDTGGELLVTTTSLPDILRKHSISTPHVMKVDVEGSEISILSDGESRAIVCTTPSVAIEVHSSEAESLISSVLAACGADLRGPLRESDYIARLLPRVLIHPYLTARLYGLDAINVSKRVLSGLLSRDRARIPATYEGGIIYATRRHVTTSPNPHPHHYD